MRLKRVIRPPRPEIVEFLTTVYRIEYVWQRERQSRLAEEAVLCRVLLRDDAGMTGDFDGI